MCPSEDDGPVGSTRLDVPGTPGSGERIPRLLLACWPLGPLVRRVARLRASVHAKLLGAFLLIALLLIALGALSLQSIASVARHSRLLDQARERVDASRQVEHALGLQMSFTRSALLVGDHATIQSIFRENNRFRDTFDRLEAAAPRAQRETIQLLRSTQDHLMANLARIATLIRDNKADEAMALHLNEGYPLYREISTLVTRAIRGEEAGMGELRAGSRPPTGAPSSSPEASPWRRSSSPSCWGSRSPGPSSCPSARRSDFSGRWPGAISAPASRCRTATSSEPSPAG
jgi:CHASE3 domain sensor protein